MVGSVSVCKPLGDVEIRLDGYGTFDSDQGCVVALEQYKGKVRMMIWSDINNEEPTVVNLELARNTNYRGPESDCHAEQEEARELMLDAQHSDADPGL